MKKDDKTLLIIIAVLFLIIYQKPLASYFISVSTSVVSVNDISGSMVYDCNCSDGMSTYTSGCPPVPPCPLLDMMNASKELVDIILFDPNNDMGLSAYASYNILFSLDLTKDKQALHSEIDSYAFRGVKNTYLTCISCGIKKGIEILNQSTNQKKVIVLMSDGRANACIDDPVCVYAKSEALSEAQRAWDNGIYIYTIGFMPSVDVELMNQTATIGHGKYYYASETNLTDVYQEIGYELVPQADPAYRPLYWFNQLWNQTWEIIKRILEWLHIEQTLPRTNNVQLSHIYMSEVCVFRWTYESAPWKRCEPSGVCYLEYNNEIYPGNYSCSSGMCTYTFASLLGYSLGNYIHTEWICDGMSTTIDYRIVEPT